MVLPGKYYDGDVTAIKNASTFCIEFQVEQAVQPTEQIGYTQSVSSYLQKSV
jgi:hypothetical protein